MFEPVVVACRRYPDMVGAVNATGRHLPQRLVNAMTARPSPLSRDQLLASLTPRVREVRELLRRDTRTGRSQPPRNRWRDRKGSRPWDHSQGRGSGLARKPLSRSSSARASSLRGAGAAHGDEPAGRRCRPRVQERNVPRQYGFQCENNRGVELCSCRLRETKPGSALRHRVTIGSV